jgi:hypothetical protein
MTFLLVLPAALSFWVLGAHYLREGNLALVVLCAAMPTLLLLRQRWVLRALQFLLVLGCVAWLLTAWELLQERMARHEASLRMVLILGAVAAFCLVAAALLGVERVKKRYPVDGRA